MKTQLEGFFTGPQGPGSVESGAATGKLVGLVAPHIDLQRGGQCFGWSYAELARESRATTYVILGIAHTETQKCYALTTKDFETPLGTLPADKEFIAELAASCSHDFFIDEFLHRSEHSIEFQALFLKQLYCDRNDIRIVPVLCATPSRILLGQSSYRDSEEVNEFAAALKKLIDDRGENVCCIAGVDLSHVGRRFGQDIALSGSFIKQVEADDRSLLQHVIDRDADAFLETIERDNNRNNVCGVPAIYTLLRVLQPKSAKLLKYDQAVDEETQSLVSFAGAAFYRS